MASIRTLSIFVIKCVLFAKRPPEFLANYRNPCWRGTSTSRATVADASRLASRDASRDAVVTRCLPYFMIVGQPKCGTSDLYYNLIAHQSVVGANKKEPQWWSRRRWDARRSFDEYIDSFSNAAERIEAKYSVVGDGGTPYHDIVTGEATSTTLWDPMSYNKLPGNSDVDEPRFITAHYVKMMIPDVKIIISLRNPVERLFSAYNYFEKEEEKSPELFHAQVLHAIHSFVKCKSTRTLRACVYSDLQKSKLRLRNGCYHTFIADWLDVFPASQVKVVRLEDYSTNRLATLKNVFEFLRLEPMNEDLATTLAKDDTIHNVGRRKFKLKSTMLNTTRQMLESFYKPFNDNLSVLLNDRRFLWE